MEKTIDQLWIERFELDIAGCCIYDNEYESSGDGDFNEREGNFIGGNFLFDFIDRIFHFCLLFDNVNKEFAFVCSYCCNNTGPQESIDRRPVGFVFLGFSLCLFRRQRCWFSEEDQCSTRFKHLQPIKQVIRSRNRCNPSEQ